MAKFLTCLLLSLLALALPALAAPQTPWQQTSAEVRVRLISGVAATGQESSLPLGLDIKLADHWKTYWRSPGSAGLPISINWQGSSNLKSATLHWPAPHRFTYAGLENFGYTDQVVLPITLTPEHPGHAVHAQAQIELMACAELCIPFSFELTLDLPAGPADTTAHAKTIVHWMSRVPAATHPEMAITGLLPIAGGYEIQVHATPPLTAPELIVEAESGTVFGPPVLVQGTPAKLTVKSLGASESTPLPTDPRLTLTLIDGTRLLEVTRDVSAPLASAPPPGATSIPPQIAAQPLGLFAALIAAFIGGLILNLMPCVLPVLSLKLLAVVSHGGNTPRHVRLSFLASAAGILTSFLLLAAVAIAFKQAGVAIGWGIQFQHPAFVAVMAALLTLFAASLWELIHIPLPRFLADAVNDSLPTPGQHDRTLLGNFLTGAFTTLLATPCSAPFVGTAIGFALAGSTRDILLTALVMGFGLATPFLLVATFPGLAHRLPRPGSWMNWLRKILALALFLSAIWLASTARQQLAAGMASIVLGLPVLIIFVLWIRASIARPILLLKGAGAFIILMLALVGLDAIMSSLHKTQAPQQPIAWQVFDETRIPGLVAEGKTVFVDVTADWCLTCLANKRLVIEDEPVRGWLNDPQVVAMKADWTRPNELITAYLRRFGRYGIPFNIVYGPGAPQGIPLPELLNAAVIEKALRNSAAPAPQQSCTNC